jgi:hypothetical protein
VRERTGSGRYSASLFGHELAAHGNVIFSLCAIACAISSWFVLQLASAGSVPSHMSKVTSMTSDTTGQAHWRTHFRPWNSSRQLPGLPQLRASLRF